jgi:glycoside/pentoside/hexuronide:cation symporter, GPH family
MTTSSTATAPKLIFWREKIGYAVGDTACCLFWVIVSSFLNIFYTDVFGLAPAALAGLLFITRLWDAAFDPIVGMFADRTSSRWGKFRPWILWGILPFMVAEIALFYTPGFGPTGKLVYAYVTYSLVMLIYSGINVPYGALLGVITPNSSERTALASYRFVGAFAGNFIVQGTLLWMVSHFGRGNDRVGFTLAVTVLAFASGGLFLYLFASTKERVLPPVERNSVGSDLKDLMHNRPWVTLFMMGATTLVYITFRQVTTVYYFAYYVGDKAMASTFLLAGTVFSILGAISTPYLVPLFGGKKATFIGLTLIGAACNAATYLAGPRDLVLIFATHMLGSIPQAAIFPLMGSMYADTADYGDWKFGRRATGLIFAGSTFSQKTGGAIGAALVNVVLSLVGYKANVVQSATSIAGLRHLMSTLPAVFGLAVVGLSMLYRLSTEDERRIAQALRERKSPGSVPQAPASA